MFTPSTPCPAPHTHSNIPQMGSTYSWSSRDSQCHFLHHSRPHSSCTCTLEKHELLHAERWVGDVRLHFSTCLIPLLLPCSWGLAERAMRAGNSSYQHPSSQRRSYGSGGCVHLLRHKLVVGKVVGGGGRLYFCIFCVSFFILTFHFRLCSQDSKYDP